jgi:aspartate dehydrogenase
LKLHSRKRRIMKIIGIIGCGAIGALVAQAVETGIIKCDGLILYDYNEEKAERLQKSLNVPAKTVRNVDEMIRLKPAAILEAASQQAVREYIDAILAANVEFVVMSVGALLDLRVKSNKIHFPSGAIGGLDAISSAALAGIDDVVLTTRKSPRVLDSQNKEQKVMYEGSAVEAARLFPREMNVAAALALVAGAENVKVRVISDPGVDRNVHEIRVKWKHGDMFLRFENDRHPESPGTSALAPWSAIQLLKELLEKLG